MKTIEEIKHYIDEQLSIAPNHAWIEGFVAGMNEGR
jgi:hypothetical protein